MPEIEINIDNESEDVPVVETEEIPVVELEESTTENTNESGEDLESWRNALLEITRLQSESLQEMRSTREVTERTNRMLVGLVESTQQTNATLTAQMASLIPPALVPENPTPPMDTPRAEGEEIVPLEVEEIPPPEVEERPRPKRRRL